MRPNKNDSTPAKPLVYEALAAFNRHVEQVLEDVEQMRALGLFLDRQILRACRATLEETRAWANFEILEILNRREERDWERFGRFGRRAEKAWAERGASTVSRTRKKRRK